MISRLICSTIMMSFFRKFASALACWILAVFLICIAAVLVGVFVQQLPQSAYGTIGAAAFIWAAHKLYKHNNHG